VDGRADVVDVLVAQERVEVDVDRALEEVVRPRELALAEGGPARVARALPRALPARQEAPLDELVEVASRLESRAERYTPSGAKANWSAAGEWSGSARPAYNREAGLEIGVEGGRDMRILIRVAAVLLVGLIAGSAGAQARASLPDVLKAMRDGGYVIVVRHGATHDDQADTDPFNLDNVAKQRQLNDKGRADAQRVGEVLKAAGVTIGKSYSSRFYRAVETARLIGGKDPQATLDITEGGLVVSTNENNRRNAALRALIAVVPDPGTNTLIVSHRPNIMDALGKEWFDVREGEASIFKPDGRNSYDLVARIRIGQWAALKN
jgi:phosphohistidine phosphatase SixA